MHVGEDSNSSLSMDRDASAGSIKDTCTLDTESSPSVGLISPNVSSASDPVQKLVFGLSLRNSQFPHHSSTLLRLNNGSFGACPRSVLNFQSGIRNQWLQNPDGFWTQFEMLMEQSRWSVAEMVGANGKGLEDVCLVDNTAVASSLVAEEALRLSHDGDAVGAILISNFTHGEVRNAMDYACRRSDFRLRLEVVELPFPVYDNEMLVDTYRAKIEQLKEKGIELAMAVLDHVSSLPSVLHPVISIASICRGAGFKRIFVDGTQALGTVSDLDVPSIGADYYVGSLHKWVFAPTSAAFLWTKGGPAGVQGQMHHPIVSHNFDRGLAQECGMLGTRDYTALLSIPAGVEFFRTIGQGGKDAAAVVCRRNHDLVVMAAMDLAESWGTQLGTGEDMCTSMVMLGLPECFGSTCEEAAQVKDALMKGFNIVVQRPYPADGRLWLRLSGAVYNHRKEYDKLGDAVADLCLKKEEEAAKGSGGIAGIGNAFSGGVVALGSLVGVGTKRTTGLAA